jgi:uncharacterized protein (DUF885 family)
MLMVDTIQGLADEAADILLDAFPVSATLLGIRDRDARLPDHSEAGERALEAGLRDLAARAEAVDPADLSAEDRVTRLVVVDQARVLLDQLSARGVEYTLVDSFLAPAVELLTFLPMIGIATQEHADGYLARLAGIPDVLAALAERHRAGIAAGRLPVRYLAEATVAYLDRLLADPAADPLRRTAPPADGPVDRAAFEADRDRLLEQVVRPAVARYRDAIATDVAPHGRPEDRAGLCWLPDGPGYYTALARAHTTTDRTPEELHQTGLEIIARLGEEYVEIGSRVFGAVDLAEVLRRLRTDPALRWTSERELLDSARAAIARAEAAAPRWFGRMPVGQCAVEPVPAEEAPGSPGAYYLPPALDGTREGTYFANTYRFEERDRTTSEVTAFHEAVPGHHFQLTLALQLTHLPLVRRLFPFTAYAEGWGLYTERLADEMGLYSDDAARLGMVSLDAMRAARLVVDTGLHAKGWDRQRAVDFMLSNTAIAAVEIEAEVDRYISAPGQALAYMVGKLEIQRMRAWAEREMGDRFDIRAFHDTVLGSGSLPLGALDELVRAWAAGP